MKKIIYGLLLVMTLPLAAQNHRDSITFESPFDFPLSLSGNFGAIRTNHFHSGLDIRTEWHIGKTVLSVADGYVSRISVSHTGYGNALYITHPNGFISVYGHLDHFSPRIQSYVEKYQYAHETFEMDVNLSQDVLPVKAREEIATSGDTGFSGGPHLHFELRDARTGNYVNPAIYLRSYLSDSIPPKAYGLKVYFQDGKVRTYTFERKDSVYALNDTIRAWGNIGLAVKTYDFADNSYYRFGVRRIRLLADSTEVFSSDMECFSDGETRYVNAWTDSNDSGAKRGQYLKSFILPGNALQALHAIHKDFTISINEERLYFMEYILTDDAGNESRYPFIVKGEKQEETAPREDGGNRLPCLQDNVVSMDGFELKIPKGNLYEDTEIDSQVRKKTSGVADEYRVLDGNLPLHSFCSLKIKLMKDNAEEKNKYYLSDVRGTTYLGGTYEDGWIKGETRELGTFTVREDNTAPKIVPVDKRSWSKTGEIVFKISDSGSGIKTYKGKIDGKFALFKSSLNHRLTCNWKELPFALDGEYELTMEAEDRCGNKAEYTASFSTKVVHKTYRRHHARTHRRRHGR